jgi:hypothetical protein
VSGGSSPKTIRAFLQKHFPASWGSEKLTKFLWTGTGYPVFAPFDVRVSPGCVSFLTVSYHGV